MSDLSSHTGVISRHRPSLRERKKEQTRARIIDVALRLCDEQGFDATTVEQIADTADVSPRTVNRYFESKEDIVIAPITDWARAHAEALREQPHTGNEMQALLDSFLAIVDRVVDRDEPLPFRWFQQMQRIIAASAPVRACSLAAAENKTEQTAAVLAERLGTTVNDVRVRLLLGTFHAIMRAGTECEVESGSTLDQVLTSPRGMADAVVAAYHEFVRTCAAPTVASPTSETAASAR
ncbi:TetR/AcrR family transcriptional regulator [Nocardia sp. CDC160]|uniref:TetR/AcrR family transcriptional regulator n=1 Tax=Nocardia sp. CDC160 TaxID=3112166 RepID=UPI002DB7728A|nr:helix-turn-helix domain-containing protein [Nocardia sp. CDC160]MEC3913161.1 helix-turn-helix domain-containing protein [Nocardia sp. CDC160]